MTWIDATCLFLGAAAGVLHAIGIWRSATHLSVTTALLGLGPPGDHCAGSHLFRCAWRSDSNGSGVGPRVLCSGRDHRRPQRIGHSGATGA